MKLSDLTANPIYQTRGIAADTDPPTAEYLKQCLDLFFTGNYGEIPPEDTEANDQELAAGEGRIIARYKKAHNLQGDIYIIAYFSQSTEGIDANNTTILYCSEY